MISFTMVLQESQAMAWKPVLRLSVQRMPTIDQIVIVVQARAGLQGRSWPLGGSVRAGVVPSWSDVLGAELGHVPPCLDSRSAAYVRSCLCSASALACIACTYLGHHELESKKKNCFYRLPLKSLLV